ncbi:hypothetical protein BBB02_05370 [Wolbachia endosymbiont of Bemisia tabaci]|uniref:hypothetical protein n=1 Tax=Wolbachia endosymbiont of Bemisia tabaci TaxID=215173 RepID=UPI000FD17A1F|nr:hypothetical protein [Wolbachia endosymbiont of Bemisia tabaci]AZU37879.1 hypothetical protein BBB02_05370 [Wolbachia endosymbiont of Bemisia tabaci]
MRKKKMPSPYSEDLKERILKGVDKKNQSNIQSEHKTNIFVEEKEKRNRNHIQVIKKDIAIRLKT